MVTVVLVALAAATLLDSQGALAAAQDVRYSGVRTPLVSVLRPVDQVAEAIGLDVPYDALARTFGNAPAGSSEADPDGLAAKAKALAEQRAKRPAGPSPSPAVTPSSIPYLVDGLPLPAALPQPEPGHPLRVLVTGDSMAGEPGYALSDLLGSADRSDLDVRDEPYAGTGLTRPDAFDWSLKAASQAATEHPDVAVVFLGENDGFPLEGVSPYSTGWQRLYSARVQAVINAYQAGGVKLVIWAAPPIDAQTNPAEGGNVNAIFRNIGAAVRDAVSRVPAAAMMDQYQLFSVGGRYSTSVPDPTTGATVANTRLPDGSHLTRAGGMIVARLLLRYLDREAAQRNQQAEAAQRGDPVNPAPGKQRATQQGTQPRRADPSPAPGPSRADGAPAVGSGHEDAALTGTTRHAGSQPEHPAQPLGLVLIMAALAVVYGRGVITRRLLRGRPASSLLTHRFRGARSQVHTRPYVGARSRGTHSPGPDTVTAAGRVGTVPPTRPVTRPATADPDNSGLTQMSDPATVRPTDGGPPAAGAA
ncbi:hypothetical protein Raf01_62360 [Rugosimonospora africana]|uniref:SGNH hydrolase-type esterase domain-containing protein n=2 Tax=Rugosimonospora africana TaxID=556532 RepID=A0A8J3QVW8_9ACTN|nr:hypothetical protein Raf01_62360 [Rugosimonospora africana]